jgi:hypothetical protein
MKLPLNPSGRPSRHPSVHPFGRPIGKGSVFVMPCFVLFLAQVKKNFIAKEKRDTGHPSPKRPTKHFN